MAGSVGRPRKSSPRRSGRTAREEILDASAELFTKQGFATTSTHEIADAVGVRQASLYYHFPSKADIFLTLLKSTIEPSLALGAVLRDSDASANQKLWALVAAQTRLLLSSKWNIGRLYQLPVATSEEFVEYHKERAELEDYFRSFAAEIVGDDDPLVEIPFHMSLAAVEMRDNTGKAPYPLVTDALPSPSVMLADAVLDVPRGESDVTETTVAVGGSAEPAAPSATRAVDPDARERDDDSSTAQ